MEKSNFEFNEISLEEITTAAIQIPGVKVDRREFLAKAFSKVEVNLQQIWEEGPVQAGVSQAELWRIADRLILDRTSTSSILSFAAGLPGGFAMAATIPADILQFFGMTFRLAQELSYLYGAQDIWQNGEVDNDRVRNQLMLYCGVMFGVTGAAAGVRVLSAQLAKTALKKIPQKALTKTFWYPLVKQIGKAIGVKVTKTAVAQGVAKAIPLVGGAISGSLNFASMMPMARRLRAALDEACFGYTEEAMDADVMEIESIDGTDKTLEKDPKNISVKERVAAKAKCIGGGMTKFLSKKEKQNEEPEECVPERNSTPDSLEDVFEKLKKLSELKDMGVITQEEFESKKSELLTRI